jgi:hypothetical protein
MVKVYRDGNAAVKVIDFGKTGDRRFVVALGNIYLTQRLIRWLPVLKFWVQMVLSGEMTMSIVPPSGSENLKIVFLFSSFPQASSRPRGVKKISSMSDTRPRARA